MTFSRLVFAIVAAGLAVGSPAFGQGAAAPASTGAAPSVPAAAGVKAGEWVHALSLFGDVKYPADFKHFDYVNPQAPKGGVVRLGTQGTFDSFNLFVTRGTPAVGLGLIYDTLLSSGADEPNTAYGLLAEAVKHPADYSSASFRLRAGAKWHDGRPITVEDVVWSLDTLKKIDPTYQYYYRHVVRAEASGEREVTFVFDAPGNREMPAIMGQLPVLPKHWWTGTDAQGRPRDIAASTLEPPLGSAAYKVKGFSPGRWVAYERVADYWAKDLPVNVGKNNFDEIRYEYFRDSTVLLEAFKGDQYDFRLENSAKNWATEYDFPALREKRVVKEEFDDRERGIMQAFVLNTRRDKFKDWRVRRAINLAYDFEEINKTLMFSAYERVSSFFHGTELASSGLPSPAELAFLEPLRGKIPESVFTEPYRNPVGGNAENVRANLREATRLLREAGWEIKDRRLTHVKTGERMVIEFLYVDPNAERPMGILRPNLERLGIEVTMRNVDTSQYVNRVRAFDFDMVTGLWPQSLSPGNEQREFWGSEAAERQGSRNLIGIKDEAVDRLIEAVIFAKDRAALVAATKALDRVLLHNNFVVPQFSYNKDRTARWDRFSRPDKLPPLGALFPTVWWYDGAKAAKVGGR